VELEWRRVDFAGLVDAAAAGIRPTAEAKGIRFVVKVDHQTPRILGDQTRLQQVVWNLLTNAVKFTPQGGEVRTEIRNDGSQVVLTVSDSGQGIDPAFVPFVFDMFRQADSALNRTHGGLGIGLSIVRRLVELHGGTVSAASPGAGRGATFTVALPYLPAAPVGVPAWADPPAPSQAAPTS
jgi:signal transduction histidine kinase